MLHRLILEVHQVMHLGRMLLNLRKHLLFTRTFKMPVTRIPNVLAMKLFHQILLHPQMRPPQHTDATQEP